MAGIPSNTIALRHTDQRFNQLLAGPVFLYDRGFRGMFDIVGNIAKSDFENKIKSVDFNVATVDGTNVTEGKPITQLDQMVNLTINSPSMRTLDLALFGSGVTQAAARTQVASAAKAAITVTTLDIWYPLADQHVSGFTLSNAVPTVLNDQTAASPDYVVDTELGMFMPLSSGTITNGTVVTPTYQVDAIAASMPNFSPRSLATYSQGAAYILIPVAANEARAGETWVRYMPRVRVEPSGKMEIGAEKLAEVQLLVQTLPSSKNTAQPYGYLNQISGTPRAIGNTLVLV